ncbi:MAG: hypothetical protein LBC75_03775 [Fibromonadaceae bacterium]|jgi:hypothetical protein|nr:hypothetical protein [Fibromonadaceae bacterium]
MKISWDIEKLKSVYGNEKKSQTKPFVVPGQDTAKTDNKKITWSMETIKDVYEPEKISQTSKKK